MPVPIHILLIEDDHDDINFLKDSLEENRVDFRLETLTRGDQINEYLRSNASLPDIIVMDLNLPKLHGREVLCKIRENKRFGEVPLTVLTTSSLEEDRNFCLKNGADLFLSKPASPEGFKILVEQLKSVAGRPRTA